MDSVKKRINNLVEKTKIIKNKHKKLYRAILTALMLIIMGIYLKYDIDIIKLSIKEIKELHDSETIGQPVMKGLFKILTKSKANALSATGNIIVILANSLSFIVSALTLKNVFVDKMSTENIIKNIKYDILYLLKNIMTKKFLY